MIRGPIYRNDYRPQLSGHETFPLRYGWLKKAFDAVKALESREAFTSDDAIARFGVGKNMVASMRHWATMARVIEEQENDKSMAVTPLGEFLFGDPGVDPYMENLASSWLVHWILCTTELKTTWFWTFHYYPALTFDRENLVEGIELLARDLYWTRASTATIRRDVSCFLRTYIALSGSGPQSYEDGLESPLTELGLIKATGRRDGFRFVRGPKPTLGLGVFCCAVTEFWESYFSGVNTLSFEALAHEPGSPGRAFLLDEDTLADMLAGLESFTRGRYRWSETAGLKQLVRNRGLSKDETMRFLAQDYSTEPTKKELAHAAG